MLKKIFAGVCQIEHFGLACIFLSGMMFMAFILEFIDANYKTLPLIAAHSVVFAIVGASTYKYIGLKRNIK